MQQYFNDILSSIQKMVSFPSVQGKAEEGAPFGKDNLACLTAFLALAQSMGFETKNYDGYVGEVTFGQGEDFAILAHLDVVPPGSGWKYPPYDGVIADGKLYGRGTTDDKGPAVIALYCLNALKQEGFMPKRKIKLILGCNEETGWGCIEHYKQVAKMPDEGFTPDSGFPVIYAEKGIAHLQLQFPVANPPFATFTGGTAANMVCDAATATGVTQKVGASQIKDTTLTQEGDKVTATGVCAHGSTPEKGASALQALLKAFDHPDCQRAYKILFDDELHLKKIHDETGYLTISPNQVTFDGKHLLVTVDFRYPSTHTLQEVTTPLKKEGIAYTVLHHQLPLYNSPNGKLIQTLSTVYSEVTGKDGTPIAVGGGTYARALKNGCAFGPEEDDEEVTIHQPNEYIKLEKIKQLSEIYYLAIKRICE